jgi:hypothetical protein
MTLLYASALATLALAPAFATNGPSDRAYVCCLTLSGAINRFGLAMPKGAPARRNHIEIRVGGAGAESESGLLDVCRHSLEKDAINARSRLA